MEQQLPVGRSADIDSLNWTQWQRAVLVLLRSDASGVLRSIELDDVDWDQWRSFYTEGRSPRSAIDRALARDF